jgi:transcriptional regulator with GAF, ATPase, and Fis domain
VASTDFTVLIEGETGTGKELVADAIHQASPRAGGPLVVFDCSAGPPTLLESMLFGHEKGAFTGATEQRIGCFEEANQGTLFLDELGELPVDLQSKLLRALEKGEFRRVGGSATLRSDARVLAATNRDLAREVNRGSFRADLYYRVAVVRLVVPPLRNRLDDVIPLVRHFAKQTFRGDETATDRYISGLSTADWTGMRRHSWPGNVRELRNAVQRSIAMGDGLTHGTDLSRGNPEWPSQGTAPDLGLFFDVDLDRPFLEQKKEVLAKFEQMYLSAQLERHDGVVARAARAAEIDRMYYRRLLKKRI